jgi:hypothetical protein
MLEGSHQVTPDPILDALKRILALEPNLPDEMGTEKSVVVPASLLHAVYQELARLTPIGNAQLSFDAVGGPVEALTSALACGAGDTSWALRRQPESSPSSRDQVGGCSGRPLLPSREHHRLGSTVLRRRR